MQAAFPYILQNGFVTMCDKLQADTFMKYRAEGLTLSYPMGKVEDNAGNCALQPSGGLHQCNNDRALLRASTGAPLIYKANGSSLRGTKCSRDLHQVLHAQL